MSDRAPQRDPDGAGTAGAYPDSAITYDGARFRLERADDASKRLVVEAADASVLHAFEGRREGGDQGTRLVAPTTPENAAALRAALPWLTPSRFGLHTSVGFGDRLGIATPGHVRALREVGAPIRPVFAQQSIREMGRCGRTPRDVLDDATWGAFQAGWTEPVGGDADHLEELADVDATAAAGFVFYTLDPKANVDPEAEHADAALVRQKVEALDWAGLDSDLDGFRSRHVGQRVDLEHEAVKLDEESVLRALAKYGPSMAHAMAMYRRLMDKGIDCEVEFAVDETDYPTKPAEHVVVVRELQRLGMEFVSFAPRFVGRFEKGVEFIGDLDALERDFQVHAQLARALGPYKLSLHSGSDKYSTYPLIAEATQGMVHLKTAGTSWAEALRVLATHDPDLMRQVLTLALDSFEANVKSYHLSCDPAKIPTDPTDEQVARLLDVVDSRQVLHVGYGAILAEFRPQLYRIWDTHEEELYGIVSDHFVRHLAPFAAYTR
ncbi:tagaturonate epimerase family protein [Microlunatus flavus]|uniref:Tagaturonate epimerase n=1 Tax=Microlunatus flavus TaxID=1036181 RepID=A0A1H9G1W4_9ACTN|nr:tagaturonate epimerase family protein [Microlunatus flavus]SEQ44145.1 tagaturonate epimerase [Microlunatus flavus]